MGIPQCIAGYRCKTTEMPYNEAVYTPYLKVTVGGQTLLLSGNASSPIDPHHAMITSFQYGAECGTGGCGFTLEAVDEGGVCYEKIYDALNKDITKTVGDDKKAIVEFGWKLTGCNGNTSLVTNLTSRDFPNGGGDTLKFHPRKLSATFDGGVVKFVLEATDLFAARSGDARLESNIGTEDNKVSLKTALRRLSREYDPQFDAVRFINKDGEEDFPFLNKHGGPDGYVSVHNMDQETNVGCARKWLNNTLTSEERGIFILYDPKDSAIVFLEDPADGGCCGKNNLGTFIVNGGNKSNVISFNPTFDWKFSGNTGTGGVASGGSSADSGEAVKQGSTNKADGIVNVGSQSQHLADGNQFHWMPPSEQTREAEFCFNKHSKATRSYEGMVAPIEAELKIIGNPSFVNPLFLTSKWVTIVVIDPYYIKKDTSSGDACEWLAEPNCNPILSNKKWMIKGIDHQITSGSYFTTIKVHLAAPGVDIPSGSALGECGTKKERMELEPKL